MIERYLSNKIDNYQLTILCVMSKVKIEGIFSCQGFLFDHEDNLNKTAGILASAPTSAYHKVSTFTELSCFKHRTAFDKMAHF